MPTSSASRATVAQESVSDKFKFLLLEDANEAARVAADHLLQCVRERGPRNVYVSFDIDDTLLSYVDPHDDYCTRTVSLSPSRELYALASRLGVYILLITARSDSVLTAQVTQQQLLERGYSGYAALVLRPVHVTPAASDVAAFKALARARLVPPGATLALNVGDQFTDLLGAFPDSEYAEVYKQKQARAFYAVQPTDARDRSTLHVKLPHLL